MSGFSILHEWVGRGEGSQIGFGPLIKLGQVVKMPILRLIARNSEPRAALHRSLHSML